MTLVQIRDGRELDYSRWQQSLIGVLMIDIEYDEEVGWTKVSLMFLHQFRQILTSKIKVDRPARAELMLEAKLGYRNKGDPQGEWKEYARYETDQICPI